MDRWISPMSRYCAHETVFVTFESAMTITEGNERHDEEKNI
jgi:hypothetical protein